MKTNLPLFAFTALALALASTVSAQVPGIMNYQGRVMSSGTNYTGNGQFKFVLLNGANGQSLWSNDGTSVNGSQPVNPIPVPVADGVFSVTLGDTNLPNMLTIPANAFTNSDVRLRLWFDDGVNGVAQLSPDHRITAAGYSMVAEMVPDGSITTPKLANGAIDASKLADGTVTTAELAPNSVNSSHIIDGEVNTLDIANGAVTSAKIAFDAIGAAQIAPGAVNSSDIADGSILGLDIADQTITAAKLANNAVDSTKLADSLDLGSSNVSGRLDIFRTTAGTPGISLTGGSSQIQTFASDGEELIRLWGPTWGELLLKDSVGHQTAAKLTANGNSGGLLTLYNSNGLTRASVSGGNAGGVLNLYQADGSGIGAVLDGDASGYGYLSLRKANGNSGLRAYGGVNAGSLSLQNKNNLDSLVLWNWDDEEGLVSVRNRYGNETVYLWGRNHQDTSAGQIGLKKNDGTQTITLNADVNGGGGLTLNNGGSLTLNNNAGNANLLGYSYDGEEGTLSVRNKFGNETIYLWGRNSQDTSGGQIGLKKNDGTQTISLNADHNGEGRITTQVLQITGGSDLSEQFDVNAVNETLKPGMVVSIDPENPGELRLSTQAYDYTVAGVVSGAGGVKPGMLMGQAGTAADGKHPVALTGRVYCQVDASYGAIRPGDLITTSDTPGHGMKVTAHARAQGAIIGKAMTGLKSGQGLVLVLVSLQ